jgi:hypothetical protein
MRSLLVFVLALACSAAPAAAWEYLWCFEADEIRVEVDGATVTVFHDAALYNCCPEPILYDVEFGDATLLVVEHTLVEAPCDCFCCFDLAVEIPDAPPGPWQVMFRWFDLESGDWVDWHGGIEVPDVGQSSGPGDETVLNSGCVDTSGVSPSERLDWSTVKSCYR